MQRKKKREMSKKIIPVRYRILYFICLFTLFLIIPATSNSAEIDIRSKAAIVMDASTGRILYAKNPNLRLLAASTVKLMTAIVVMENASLTDVVTISKNATEVPRLRSGFNQGDKVTIETLLYAALIKSANDAAVALAEATAGSEQKFVELMNRKASEIGARDTRFINPNGLPGPGQYTTAFDLSKIMMYALRYPKLREIIGTRITEVSNEDGNSIFLKNTNKLLWSDQDLVGGKTGYTRKARHCFVCAAERGEDAIVVVLLGSPSRDNLWREAELLLNKGFQVEMGNGEPEVYPVKADYDSLYIKKASYKKISKFKDKNTNKKAVKKAKKDKKAKVFVKKNVKTKTLTKKMNNKKKKNYSIANKGEVGNKG
jgi:D-alanyl-D-alanine carboxypeptidase (penicillin-binding protein 5/6)